MQPSADDVHKSLTFRWIDPTSDPQEWEAIQSAFRGELAPDVAGPGQDALDVYRYKYVARAGIVSHSAVVFIGHRPAKKLTTEREWDQYCSAFNFDTDTHQKAAIEQAATMWKLKFRTLATFGPAPIPDVTFTYLTCTECEPDLVFAPLQYDPKKSAWRVRPWGDGKAPWWAAKDGLIVDVDVNNGGDTISFDCAYGVFGSKKIGFNDVAVRCKEVAYADSGKAKIDDSTLIYSSSDGVFRSRRVSDDSEVAALNTKMCQQHSRSVLCSLPFYLTATAGQSSALDEMVPNPPKTVRELACFRSFTKGTSINDVVKKCGGPDELGGSGINIFVYHLDDGSLVAIGGTGLKSPILYANHIETGGKATSLIATK